MVLPPACESSIRNGDVFRYGKEDLLPCSTTQTLSRPSDSGVPHFQGQLLGCGWLGCGWFVLRWLAHSLLLQYASGGPACGCAVTEGLTMQTIASYTGQGRFRGSFKHSESGTSDSVLPPQFQPGQPGLGRNV